ncbi:nucleotidyltransferase domain-containing protein [Candidatus Aerophobetes bacterium]|nr:nucleotidyltransferase domain-containing protein [Candidatus Aerophobetes bacterium]
MQGKYSGSVRIFYPRFDRQTIIKIIKEKTQVLKKELPILLVVLFGSYAQDNYTVKSDIDLLIIYRGKIKDVYARVKKVINIYGTEPHIYSEEEYTAIKPTIDKMIKNGIVIFKQK